MVRYSTEGNEGGLMVRQWAPTVISESMEKMRVLRFGTYCDITESFLCRTEQASLSAHNFKSADSTTPAAMKRAATPR